MAPAFRRSRRSTRTTATAAATAVLVLGAAGCAIDLSDWRPGGPEPSPSPTPVSAGPILESALDALAELPAVQLTGQFAPAGDEEEAPVQTDLTVTDTGAALGTFQTADGDARYMEVDRKLFIDAGDGYWLDQGVFNPDSDSYADHWVRVGHSALGLDPGGALTPSALSDILRARAPEGESEAVEEKLAGTVAYRVDLSGGKVWVTKDEPHTLIRMQVEELAPEDGGLATRIEADFAAPDTAAVEKVYDDLAAIAEDDLGSARDSRIEVQWEDEGEMSCQTGGKCTISGTVRDVGGGSGEATVLVRMDGTFSNSELGEKKCSKTGRLKAGGTVELACSTDYELAPSTNPQSYEVSGNRLLSTRALSGDAKDAIVGLVKEQREATLEGGAQASPEASPSGN
ncbi:hypothetical protein [Nocardiopsis ansamitocini]|uniref:Lipoprotein n=1 Tax=Nocardiopsis ansamitocini TaxID=1670832 RepID=A0A9W6P3H7_9ACTN|nr:hypothetical protein [Nocardiopsis ansamitocini]GLU46600.1 hypothetical protein Nans01_09510 [Nocardiopsis ansamitocini]